MFIWQYIKDIRNSLIIIKTLAVFWLTFLDGIPSDPVITLGDLNSDEQIDAIDFQLMKKYL